MVDTVQLTKTYFDTWNKHDVSGIQTLHAASSKLKVAHEFLWPLHLVGYFPRYALERGRPMELFSL